MARPQKPYAPKPSKHRNSGPDKMRMSHIRLRDDLKRKRTQQPLVHPARLVEL